MTDDAGPASEAAVRAELRSLLRSAHDNGIDVRGGWECFNDETIPNWDVVITEVESGPTRE